jgi:CRISPR/Cas system-associated exonuclease Cas4 (RecB family)
LGRSGIRTINILVSAYSTLHKMIDKILDNVKEDAAQDFFADNDTHKIHATEVSRCTRLSYFERKDPLPGDNIDRISTLIRKGVMHSFRNIVDEYKVDSKLTIEVTADLILDNEFIVKFEAVSSLPEIPHPRDLLYLNACLFAFNKFHGILVYATVDGKSEEFSVTKSNRMFEEIVRRAKVLYTLLTEGKPPIVEPSDSCISCKYYGRCYNREKKNSNYSLENLLAFRKK